MYSINIVILKEIISFIHTQMHQDTLQLTLERDLPVKCYSVIYSWEPSSVD